MPKQLNDAERKLFEELARVSPFKPRNGHELIAAPSGRGRRSMSAANGASGEGRIRGQRWREPFDPHPTLSQRERVLLISGAKGKIHDHSAESFLFAQDLNFRTHGICVLLTKPSAIGRSNPGEKRLVVTLPTSLMPL